MALAASDRWGQVTPEGGQALTLEAGWGWARRKCEGGAWRAA